MKRLVVVLGLVTSLVTSALVAAHAAPSVVTSVPGRSPGRGAGPPELYAPRLVSAHRGAAAAGECATCSVNWAGYVQVATARGSFTSVTDTFVVPTVESLPGTQYVADWVGIGGDVPDDSTLVQTGIQAVHLSAHGGSVTYDAWTETLPAAEKPLDLVVSAGDTVTATVQETSANTWEMEVDDVTTGRSAGRTVRYDSSGLSAEAIHERPCLRSPCAVRDFAHLAQTSAVTFGAGYDSVTPPGQTPVEEPLLAPGGNAALGDPFTVSAVEMVNDTGRKVIATPSSPNAAADGFTVADGSLAPLPPDA